MKHLTSRELLAQSLIVIAVCAGVSLGVLQPLKSRLVAERSRLSSNQMLIAQNQFTHTNQDDSARRGANAGIRTRLQSLARPAETAASLHNTLMTIAQRTGVNIEAVEPRQIALPEIPAAAPVIPGALTAPAPPARPTGVLAASVTGSGAYEAVAAFLTELDDAGLARVVSTQLTPQTAADGTQTARFTMTSMHYAFTVPAAPAQALATGGGS